jgi:DNA topoisomerase I
LDRDELIADEGLADEGLADEGLADQGLAGEDSILSLGPEPEVSASQAGLCYVEDGSPGYQRKRWGRGFTYFTPEGEHVRDPALRARFEALVIPPAWRDVWICADPRGHIQVTGRDDRGRKVYLYHPEWEVIRAQTKFSRMAPFGRALPGLRAHVDRDLRKRRFTRDKVLALVVALLDATYIRIGNPAYARDNQSYGLTTLTVEHVELSPSVLRFEFAGKSGKQQSIEVRDRRLAQMVRRLQELPGQQLFQYIPDEGDCCETVDAGDVNAYLREITGLATSAKDFRTWGGTVVAATALGEREPPESEKEAERAIREAVDTVAQVLGNTRAVCRAYYIHPAVFEGYCDGALQAAMARALAVAGRETGDRYGLDIPERAVMDLLAA